MSPPRFLSIEHVPQEGIGTIASYLQNHNAPLTRHRQYQDPSLTVSQDDYDVLIVMGGPMGVYDGDAYPWLEPELDFIRKAIEHNKKILGICLGAQLIARALSAEVRKNPCREIGWYPIQLEDAFRKTSLGPSLAQVKEVLHWHGDTFDTPTGAIRIAGSEACPNQGFLYEGNVLGLQFHLEMGAGEVETMIEHFGDQLMPERFVQSAKELQARTAQNAKSTEQAWFSLLNRWLQLWN